MSTTIDVEQWIVEKLTSDETLSGLISGVHAHPAPMDAEYNFITFDPQNGNDVNGIGGVRMFTMVPYLIRVIGKNCGRKALAPAADRMDQILVEDRSDDIACVRIAPFSMKENDEGISYVHLGGIYQFYVS